VVQLRRVVRAVLVVRPIRAMRQFLGVLACRPLRALLLVRAGLVVRVVLVGTVCMVVVWQPHMGQLAVCLELRVRPVHPAFLVFQAFHPVLVGQVDRVDSNPRMKELDLRLVHSRLDAQYGSTASLAPPFSYG
jgi:hypothetical protein